MIIQPLSGNQNSQTQRSSNRVIQTLNQRGVLSPYQQQQPKKTTQVQRDSIMSSYGFQKPIKVAQKMPWEQLPSKQAKQQEIVKIASSDKTESIMAKYGIKKPVTTAQKMPWEQLPPKLQPKLKPLISKVDIKTLDQYDFSTPTSVTSAKPKVTTPKPKDPNKLDWKDKVEEVSKDPGQLVPFLSTGKEILGLTELLASANRLREGKATKDDALLLKDFIEKQNQDTTFGYKVMNVVSQIPAFAGELALTGGVATAGRKATTKGLKFLLTKAGKEGVEELLEKFGYKVVIGVASRTLQAPVAGATRMVAGTLEKQIQSTLTVEDLADKESLALSITKSFGEQWVETVSEFSGGALNLKYLPDPIKNKIIKTALFKAFQKINPGASSEAIQQLFTKVGYNGVLAEMLEERIGEVGHGVLAELGLGDQPYKVPSLDQLAVEMVAFAVPGVTGAVSTKLVSGKDYVSQEILDKIINTQLQDTKEGKTLIKEALQAQKTGQPVRIESKEPSGVVTGVSEAKKTQGVGEVGDLAQEARKYKTTVNIQDKNDLEYLGRILSEDNIKDIQAGKMTNWQGKSYEDLARVNLVSETPKTIEQQLAGKITDVKLKSSIFYHGTSAENAKGIMTRGFKRGSDLPEDTFRGGGYGEMQGSISFAETPKEAGIFSTLSKNGEIVEAKLKDNAKVVSIKGVEDAVELEDYIKYLKKQGVDAVYLGGGEKELVVINPRAVTPVKSQLTDIYNQATKGVETPPISKPPETKVKTPEGKIVDKKIEPKVDKQKAKKARQQQIVDVKDIKDVKKTLKEIRADLESITIETEGKAVLAQEERGGLNTENIAKLKRIYSLNKKFREGDIETIRASKSGNLLNSVIENIREKYPEIGDEDAFEFALNLSTKVEEQGKNTPEAIALIKKEKILSKYLKSLEAKQKKLVIENDAELQREWELALSAQEDLRRIIGVPRGQIPVGEGRIRASRLEARINGVMKNVSEDVIERLGIATYNQMSKKENIAKAVKFVLEDQDKAIQVLTGKIEPPKGVLRNAIYVAMDNLSKGDIELARRLATIHSTRLGQEISILTELDPDSPVKIMKDIINIREEVFAKRYKGKSSSEMKDKVVKDIKKQIKKPNKWDWDTFLDSIECK